MGRTFVIAAIVAAVWMLHGIMVRPVMADLAREKEQAWQQFYTAPQSCEQPPTWRDQVDCSNRFMQAKRQFELWWNLQKTSAKVRVE